MELRVPPVAQVGGRLAIICSEAAMLQDTRSRDFLYVRRKFSLGTSSHWLISLRTADKLRRSNGRQMVSKSWIVSCKLPRRTNATDRFRERRYNRYTLEWQKGGRGEVWMEFLVSSRA